MNALENYIRSSVALSSDDLKVISAYFKPVSLAKGEFFSRRHRVCDKLAFVQSGYVRVFIEADDREVTQWISPAGYFVTDLTSFMFGTDGRWNIQTLTDCALLEVSRNDYDKLGQELPAWKELDRLLIVRCFGLMEERIMNHLYMSSEERYKHLMDTQPELFNFVPLQYLASMMGMTPETLSRLRRKQLS